MKTKQLQSAMQLRPATDWALFLDVDGTLLHLRETPDGVRRSDRVCDILEQIMVDLDGALALVSGRTIANLDELFTPHLFPTAGLHGLERRDAQGKFHTYSNSSVLDRLRPRLKEMARTKPGVIVEDKARALAVHYRQAPDSAKEVRDFVEELVHPLACELHVLHGKMVSEIKPSHADKGSAIDDFMHEPPFEARVPIFVGDDTTDEDGFILVNQKGGFSIRVGEKVDTAARYVLCDVDEVISWLESWPTPLSTPNPGIVT